MQTFQYRFSVSTQDAATACRYAEGLGDALREIDGVVSADREKTERDTMDLGTVVVALASSGSAVAIARGIAAWLATRQGVSIVLERNVASGDIKAIATGIDAQTAIRIAEIIKG